MAASPTWTPSVGSTQSLPMIFSRHPRASRPGLMVSRWRQMVTGDGCPTLLHPTHGEACHDTRGAWAEANQLHVHGCDLPRRLLCGERVRLLEVGSAPGWNLAAACSLAASLPGALEVTAVERSKEALDASFEVSADSSWRGGAPSGAPEALDQVHAALKAALKLPPGEWVDLFGEVRLRLFVQPAHLLIKELEIEEQFDALFLDSFSPGVEPEAWDPDFLFALGGRVAAGGRLSTYTISHPVRAALLASGLRVGWSGARSGRRGGTWASRGGWVPPLSDRLRARLGRHAERLLKFQAWAPPTGELECSRCDGLSPSPIHEP